MNGGRWTLAVAVAGALAAASCGHTRKAEDPTPAEAKEEAGKQDGKKQDGKKEDGKQEGREAGKQPKREGASEKKPSAKRDTERDGTASAERRRDDDKNPTPAPLATSPAGLLKPGAEKKIQDQLAGRGLLESDDARSGELDGATRAALRRFQREANLPETGVPDRETARRLGLSPDDVFRSTKAD